MPCECLSWGYTNFKSFRMDLKRKKNNHKVKNLELSAVNSKMDAGFLLDDICSLFLEAESPNFMLWWYRIVEYSVLLLESDAFQKNSWWSVGIVSLLWKQGRFYPPVLSSHQKGAGSCSPPAMLCPVVTSDSVGIFSLFLLWTDYSYFKCKLDCVTSCTHSCMDRFIFFFTFFFFPIYKNELGNEMFVFIWGVCPCAWEWNPLDVGFSMAIASPAGWRISSNPLWPAETHSSNVLIFPSGFGETLLTAWEQWIIMMRFLKYFSIFLMLRFILSWARGDLCSTVHFLKFLLWNNFFWHKQRWLQIPCVPWCVIPILSPILCLY